MLRIVFTIIWLLLSAWLVIWLGEGLFGVDQRHSVLPFLGEDTIVAPIVVGIAWALTLTFGVGAPARAFRRREDPESAFVAIEDEGRR